MDSRKAAHPSNIRLSEFFFRIIAMAIELSIKPANISSNYFRDLKLLLHPDNHSLVRILEIAPALIYHEGFVFVLILN